MKVLDDIGKFFTKTVPKVVTKDLPAFVDNLIPDVSKRAHHVPELTRQRQDVEALRRKVEAAREAFFTARADLAVMRAEHAALLEDYGRTDGAKAADTTVDPVSMTDWDAPATKADKVTKDVVGSVRTVLGFVTFDLSEGAFAPKEARKEQAHLKRQSAALKSALARLTSATRRMVEAGAGFEAEMAAMRASLAAAGAGDGAGARERLTLETAAEQARRDLAARMLADGVPAGTIALVTGLDAGAIGAIDPAGPDDAASQAPEDVAADLLADGVAADDVVTLTGIDAAASKSTT